MGQLLILKCSKVQDYLHLMLFSQTMSKITCPNHECNFKSSGSAGMLHLGRHYESSCKQHKTSMVWCVITTSVNTWQVTETMASLVAVKIHVSNVSFIKQFEKKYGIKINSKS